MLGGFDCIIRLQVTVVWISQSILNIVIFQSWLMNSRDHRNLEARRCMVELKHGWLMLLLLPLLFPFSHCFSFQTDPKTDPELSSDILAFVSSFI